MALVIVVVAVGDYLVGSVTGEVHRADDPFDEGDLISEEIVFGVEGLVCPFPCPILGRHERVDLACRMLRRFMQKDKKTS